MRSSASIAGPAAIHYVGRVNRHCTDLPGERRGEDRCVTFRMSELRGQIQAGPRRSRSAIARSPNYLPELRRSLSWPGRRTGIEIFPGRSAARASAGAALGLACHVPVTRARQSYPVPKALVRWPRPRARRAAGAKLFQKGRSLPKERRRQRGRKIKNGRHLAKPANSAWKQRSSPARLLAFRRRAKQRGLFLVPPCGFLVLKPSLAVQ